MSDERKAKPGLAAEVLAAVNAGRAARGAEPLVRGPGYREPLLDAATGDTYDGREQP